jgi:hypothetical protein
MGRLTTLDLHFAASFTLGRTALQNERTSALLSVADGHGHVPRYVSTATANHDSPRAGC